MSTNKTRMRDSRILLVIAFIVALFSQSVVEDGSGPGETMEVLGFFLLAACAIGRTYSSIFIGGSKNDKLITSGPYSVCRNPLYFYSILGAAGIGMMSREWTLFVFLTGGFTFIYHFLISREESFLAGKFGTEFSAFSAATPRLIPDFKKYNAPEEMVFQPRYVNKAVWDGVWWLAASPVFEIMQYLHDKGFVKTYFTLI